MRVGHADPVVMRLDDLNTQRIMPDGILTRRLAQNLGDIVANEFIKVRRGVSRVSHGPGTRWTHSQVPGGVSRVAIATCNSSYLSLTLSSLSRAIPILWHSHHLPGSCSVENGGGGGGGCH